MEDVVVGFLAVLVGGLFCFRGYLAMRIVIPIWGAFAGFVLGAGLVASFTDDGFMQSLLAWLVGAGIGLVFAFIAYLYYEISVVIAMASMGFALGTSAMVALNVSWSWVIILVGVAAGTLLAVAAIAADLPTALLVLLSALAGASAVIAGVMLIVGKLDTDDFGDTITKTLEDSWWWWIAYAVLAVAGLISQARSIESLRGSMRDAWVDSGGQTMRS